MPSKNEVFEGAHAVGNINTRIAGSTDKSAEDTMTKVSVKSEMTNQGVSRSEKVVEVLEGNQIVAGDGRASPSTRQEAQTVNKSDSDEDSSSGSSSSEDEEKELPPSTRFYCIGAMVTMIMLAATFVGVLFVFLNSQDNQVLSGSDLAEPQLTSQPQQPAPSTPALRPTLVPALDPTLQPDQESSTGPPVSQWLQQGVNINGESNGGLHSWSVALSADGTTVAVGGCADADAGSNAGRTRVYRYASYSGWFQVGDDISGENSDDFSGWAISISGDGNTVAIGSHGSDGDSDEKIDAGRVRVIQRDGAEWTQIGQDIDGDIQFSSFGYSVSLSLDGLSLAVGAPQLSKSTGAGYVKVFRYIEGSQAWFQVGKVLEGQFIDSQFGHSVSINEDGSFLAVGVPGSNVTGTRSGHVEVYQLTNNDWEVVGSPLVGRQEGDEFGFSVALVGNATVANTLAVGAPSSGLFEFGAGEVRVYFWIGIAWLQLGDSVGGTSAGDLSGYSISLSADGLTIAVGAPGSDNASGSTIVYRWNGAAWQQLGGEFIGSEPGDSFGRTVSISRDGSRVAMGAVSASVDDEDLGYAQVYNFAGGSIYT